MKPKKGKNKKTPGKEKGLWKNPSYRNMLNPYESKYPQPSKRPDSKKKGHR
jgi:hypothetical protein